MKYSVTHHAKTAIAERFNIPLDETTDWANDRMADAIDVGPGKEGKTKYLSGSYMFIVDDESETVITSYEINESDMYKPQEYDRALIAKVGEVLTQELAIAENALYEELAGNSQKKATLYEIISDCYGSFLHPIDDVEERRIRKRLADAERELTAINVSEMEARGNYELTQVTANRLSI